MHTTIARFAALFLCASLAACGNAGYYTHLLKGQVELLRAREPITDIVADESRDPVLRRRLALVLEARDFAVTALHLPDNGSYRRYADVGRAYVLWNVFAAPEFALTGKQWCYPFYGCFTYRGYYDETRAAEYASGLRDKGWDVFVSGVPAYSTLGWFDDPVLNSMLHWDDATLIGTVFHELAHQRYFLRDDTVFNESYATFVEEEGLRQWLAARGEADPGVQQRRQRQAGFVALVQDARARLEALYAQMLPEEQMRARKADEIERLRQDYRTLRDGEWGGFSGYDRWFGTEINNAKLLPVGLYHQWVPAFEALFEQSGRDWRAFHAAVEDLGRLNADARQQRLETLAGGA
jgi:predicted aminopeptidase